MIKFYIINLERSIERRKNITEALDKIGASWEIIPAVDGRLLSNDYIDSINTEEVVKNNAGRPLTAGEIGCAESHRKAYMRLVEENLAGAVVIEDDIEISNDDIVEICNVLQKKTSRNTVVLLGVMPTVSVTPCVWHKVRITPYHTVIKSKKELRGAWAYYIDYHAARDFIEKYQKVTAVADQWERFRSILKIRLIYPNLLEHKYKYGSEIDTTKNRDYTLENKKQKNNARIIKYFLRCYNRYISPLIP